MPKKNIPLFRTVLKHVMRNPRLHDQGVWLMRDPECGTVGCIAGWAVELGEHTRVLWTDQDRNGNADYVVVNDKVNPRYKNSMLAAAAYELGLDSEEADRLFFTTDLDEVWEVVEELTAGEVKRTDLEVEIELESGEADVVVGQS
jgi:hypothetical protein